MASANKVILIGNVTRDLELRYTPNGQPVVVFSIAVNRRFKDQAGQVQERVDFVPIEVWGKQAENCKQYLAKGSSVFVEGRLQTDSWQAQDGTKRSKLKVVAQAIQFLNRAAKASAQTGPGETDLASATEVREGSVGEENLDEEIPF